MIYYIVSFAWFMMCRNRAVFHVKTSNIGARKKIRIFPRIRKRLINVQFACIFHEPWWTYSDSTSRTFTHRPTPMNSGEHGRNRRGASPKRGVGGSNPLWDARKHRCKPFFGVCSVLYIFEKRAANLFRPAARVPLWWAVNIFLSHPYFRVEHTFSYIKINIFPAVKPGGRTPPKVFHKM